MGQDAKGIVRNAVRTVLGDETIELKSDSSAEDYDGWDSVAHAKILLAIEEQLGADLPIIEVMDVQTVGELIQIVQKVADR